MSDSLYKSLRLLRLFFRYQVVGLSNLPKSGPSLLVANHVGSTGPVMLFLSLPLRFYPWVIADLTDRRRSPDYLLARFVDTSLHLRGYFGRCLAKLISMITVPLLRALGCVAVETHGTWTGAAFRRSLELLTRGRHILIFPEDPALPLDQETMIYQFKFGFVHLCQMYHDRTGTSLPVIPIAVHPRGRTIAIGPTQYYGGNGYVEPDVAEFATHLHGLVRSLYQGIPVRPRRPMPSSSPAAS